MVIERIPLSFEYGVDYTITSTYHITNNYQFTNYIGDIFILIAYEVLAY